MPRIENYIIKHGLNEDNKWLYGEVYDSPSFKDGTTISTSNILELTETYAQTRNTRYELGEPMDIPTYENKSKLYLLKKNADAIHKTGNIKRDIYDAELIVVHSEEDDFYIGNFVEGLGFIDVKFRKCDCRLASNQELDLCDKGKMGKIVF